MIYSECSPREYRNQPDPGPVPTNTTRTAAYVAVAINISVLLLLITAPRKKPKRSTEHETVMRLLLRFVLMLMITIGTMSRAPPAMATIVLVMILTGRVVCLGGWVRYFSPSPSALSAFVYVREVGSRNMRPLRRRLDVWSCFGSMQYSPEWAELSWNPISGNMRRSHDWKLNEAFVGIGMRCFVIYS